MSDADWQEVVGLARRVNEVLDLDTFERQYKLDHALRMQEAIAAVRAEDPEWPAHLRRSLKFNTLYYMTRDRVMEVVEHAPDVARRALLTLVDSRGDGQSLETFYRTMSEANEKIRMGAALATASLVLMGVDASRFAPYQSETVNRFARLVGEEPAETHDVAGRWEQFIRLLDGVLEHGGSSDLGLQDRLDAQGMVFVLAKIRTEDIPDSSLADDLARWRGEAEVVTASVARQTHDQPIVEEAAWRVLEAGLTGKSSPITGVAGGWTAEVATSVGARNADEEVAGTGTYMEKLERQLAGATREEYSLITDLLFLHHLPLVNVNASTKIERIEQVREWSGMQWTTDPWITRAANAIGSFHGGQGYSTQRWKHIVWLCAFIAKWAKLPEATRTAGLASPWEFMTLMDGVEPDIAAMRYLLSYYAWPNVFLHIVSPAHRRQIRDAFAGEIGGPSGDSDLEIARDLYDIRDAFEERRGTNVDFYEPEFLQEWQKDKSRRAWFVRLADDPDGTWRRWRAEGEVSVLARELAPEIAGAPLDSVAALVAEAHQDLSEDLRDRRARELHAFTSRIKEGDVIVAFADREYWIGEAQGSLLGAEDSAGELAVSVAWPDHGVAESRMSPQVSAAVEAAGTVIELTKSVAQLDELIEPTEEEPGVVPSPKGLEFAPVDEGVARDLHVPLEHLERFAALLARRKQMVFYGPPGTGKTYIARKLAKALGGPSRTDAVTLVQFHPSYAYEDFFEGFRPAETSTGEATFRKTAGPLKRLAEEASRPGNVNKPYFLIIDEMNRGNLAKVFGELYFLLEYRSQAVSPQYSPEERFSLPDNLFIIGTMNTTDRSVGLIDAAIRRRFPFVELHPDASPVDQVLREFLRSTHAPSERADLLDALNAHIDVRDLKIGPSYFMREGAETEEGLREIWAYDILPLMQEHLYGHREPEEIARDFALDTIRARMVTESDDS